MNERIDHADRARRAIDAGMQSVNEMQTIMQNEETAEDIGVPEYMLAAVSQLGAFAKAQAEATLALVEQQRTANLIAWTTANGSEPTDKLAKEVAGALGIIEEQAS